MNQDDFNFEDGKIPDAIANYTPQLPKITQITEMVLGVMTDDDGNVKMPLSTIIGLLESYSRAAKNDQIYADFMMLWKEGDRLAEEQRNSDG